MHGSTWWITSLSVRPRCCRAWSRCDSWLPGCRRGSSRLCRRCRRAASGAPPGFATSACMSLKRMITRARLSTMGPFSPSGNWRRTMRTRSFSKSTLLCPGSSFTASFSNGVEGGMAVQIYIYQSKWIASSWSFELGLYFVRQELNASKIEGAVSFSRCLSTLIDLMNQASQSGNFLEFRCVKNSSIQEGASQI